MVRNSYACLLIIDIRVSVRPPLFSYGRGVSDKCQQSALLIPILSKMALSFPLGMTRCVPQENSIIFH